MKILILPLAAVAFFVGAYFFFNRGGYEAPAMADVQLDRISPPSSRFNGEAEPSPIVRRSGLMVVDAFHRNDFAKPEITALLTGVADRGYEVEFVGEFNRADPADRVAALETKLRQANSLAVISPADLYTEEELGVVDAFVAKGGRLLLIADPTRRSEMNSLSERFGIDFKPDYLFNLKDYDLNFQNIFVRSFQPDELTRGLSEVILYTAGSLESPGTGLAFAEGEIQSTIGTGPGRFTAMARGTDDNVVAIYDLTFMIPPQNALADNGRLIANMADFLTDGHRSFQLTDYPHFFTRDVDILLGRASLVETGAELKGALAQARVNSEIQGMEDPAKDTVYLGLFEDFRDASPYLDALGIRVGDTLTTPFTPDIELEKTGVMALHQSRGRHVLVILGDSPETLSKLVGNLRSGGFRGFLVDDFVGVFKSS